MQVIRSTEGFWLVHTDYLEIQCLFYTKHHYRKVSDILVHFFSSKRNDIPS